MLIVLLCTARETAQPEKPTPSGFRAKNYKMRLGWNVLMLLNPKFQVDWWTDGWDIHHWLAAAILDLFWFCILYSSFFLQISLEVAQWAAIVCHNQPIWYSNTNRAISMCRSCTYLMQHDLCVAEKSGFVNWMNKMAMQENFRNCYNFTSYWHDI